ncbi:MAG: hypothetical protein ACOCUW_02980 [Gemmatimonadota bacterium]
MRKLISIPMLVILAGCASTGAGGSGSDPDELTREEILSVEASNLYEVVQRLRPRWLTAERRAGERSFGLQVNVLVYQGQTRLGTVEVLGNWSPSAVYGMEWLDGPEASATLPGLGSQHVAGAIVLQTRAPDERG